MRDHKSKTADSVILVLALICCTQFAHGGSNVFAQQSKSSNSTDFDSFSSIFKEKVLSQDFLTRNEIFEDLGGEGDVSTRAIANDLKAHPNSALAHVAQGDLSFVDGDYEQSERELAQAVKIDPKCAKAHIGLARVSIATQKFDKGLAELAKAQQLGPAQTSMNALWESAFYLREMHRYPEALAQYNALLKVKLLTGRKRAWALFHRAELYERTKRPLMAIADLTESLKIAPLTNAYSVRAKTYAEAKKYKESLADFKVAIARKSVAIDTDTSGGLRSTLAKLYRERAQVYEIMGERALAQSDLEAAHATEKNTLEAVPFRTK